MKKILQPVRVVRIPDAIHRAAKAQAAQDGIALAKFASDAIRAEVERRQFHDAMANKAMHSSRQ